VSGARKSKTILVANDNDEIRYLVEVAMQQQGYRVLRAANGEEAIVAVNNPASGVIQLVFHGGYMFAVTDNGKIYRNQINSFNNWTNVSVSALPANTTGRVDELASNGAYLLRKLQRRPSQSGRWRAFTEAPTTALLGRKF
jgi:CheY-like chemotaxis protein